MAIHIHRGITVLTIHTPGGIVPTTIIVTGTDITTDIIADFMAQTITRHTTTNITTITPTAEELL